MPEDPKAAGKGGKAAVAAAAVEAEEEPFDPYSPDTRWVVPAHGEVPLMVRFSSQDIGKFQDLLSFQVVGEKSAKTVVAKVRQKPSERDRGRDDPAAVARILFARTVNLVFSFRTSILSIASAFGGLQFFQLILGTVFLRRSSVMSWLPLPHEDSQQQEAHACESRLGEVHSAEAPRNRSGNSSLRDGFSPVGTLATNSARHVLYGSCIAFELILQAWCMLSSIDVADMVTILLYMISIPVHGIGLTTCEPPDITVTVSSDSYGHSLMEDYPPAILAI